MKTRILILSVAVALLPGCAAIADRTYLAFPSATDAVMEARWRIVPGTLDRDIARYQDSLKND